VGFYGAETKPLQSNNTRWNSTFHMLEWIHTNKLSIENFCNRHTEMQLNFSMIKDLCVLLKPFDDVIYIFLFLS
jgi:hypothetical protein